MRTYIVVTKNDRDFEILANNIKEAEQIGRFNCRLYSGKYTTPRFQKVLWKRS